jgi:hypothetical protein
LRLRVWALGALATCCLVASGNVAAAAAAAAATDANAAADSTRCLTGLELDEILRPNGVRIRAIDLGEHGFGLVVGSTARHVFVATARPVVVAREPADPLLRNAAAGRIELSFCAAGSGAPVLREAELVDGFDAGGQPFSRCA